MMAAIMEEELWVQAAFEVMMKEQRPMHYLNIKGAVMEQNLITQQLHCTIETSLYKESQKPGGRFQTVDGQPGFFMVVTEDEAPATIHSDPLPSPDQQRVKVQGHKGHEHMNGSLDRCRIKYFKLKRFIKHMIFLNAAMCDEVTRVENKVSKAKEERRFLLRKLLNHQAVSDVVQQAATKQQHLTVAPPPYGHSPQHPPPPYGASPHAVHTPTAAQQPSTSLPTTTQGLSQSQLPATELDKPGKGTKKKAGTAKRKGADDPLKPKPKKVPKSASGKRLVMPILLDDSGRPIFPVELGHLTIYSLGEIINDRPGYCTHEHIFPVGYCSTRIYASLRNPEQQCLYTCKILDRGMGAMFEISPEDAPDHVIASSNINECHCKLLHTINQARGYEIIPVEGHGAEFFGISHPTVQNLIQSCPGARKCPGYKWIKFEVCKLDIPELALFADDEPTVCFEAFIRNPKFQQATERKPAFKSVEPSASLRSLLTSGPLVQAPPGHTQ